MHLIEKLPLEVFQKILELLSRKSIFQCMQVCKLWYMSSIDEFYGNLVLNGKNIEYLERKLLLNKHKGDAGISKNGYLVKRLKIHNDAPRSLIHPHKILGTILSYFPQISKIDLSCSVDCVPYLFNLMHLKDLTGLSNVSQIQVFNQDIIHSTSGYRKIKDYYLSACFVFRASLTHLELLEPFKNFNIDENRGITYLNLLPYFSKLRHLIIHYDMENRQLAHLIYPSVLSICPNLVGFKLACSTRYTDDIIIMHPSRCINKNIIAHYPMSNAINLKILYLSLPAMDEYQMNYIVSNIRTCQLEKLVLKFDHWDTLNYWIPTSNLPRLKNFARKLSLAKDLVITIEQGPMKHDMNSISPCKLDLVKIYLQMYKLFEVLRAFQGNRDYSHFKISAIITIKRRDQNFHEISIIKAKFHNRTLLLEQAIDTKYFCKKSNNILTAKFGSGISLRNHIKKVNILVWSQDFARTLEYVVEKCIYAYDITFEVYEEKVGEEPSILTIKFPTVIYNEREGVNPRFLSVIKMDYKLAHPDIINCLSNSLPYIYELYFTNVAKHDQSYFPLTLTSIKNLRHLVLDLESTHGNGLNFVLLLITIDKNKQKIYRKYEIESPKRTDNFKDDQTPLTVLNVTYQHIDSVSVCHNGKLVEVIHPPPSQQKIPTIKKIFHKLMCDKPF